MELSKKQRRYKIDMTQGPLFSGILMFIFPLIISNLLQQFYHAADIVIVGLSDEPDAIGAVGSSGSFLALIRNLFIGFSVGANVVIARNIGNRDKEAVSQSIHTSVLMSLIFGVIGATVGIAIARPVLVGMGYTGNILALAVRYSYIYLACMPFLSLTNFLAAILRAGGNSKTPLYVLTMTGILNILLNLFFVMVLKFSVEGVAIATATANLVSAVVLWIYIAKCEGEYTLSFKKLRINKRQFIDIARIGFPAGIQNALYSISNVIIQSSVVEVNNALTPQGSAYEPIIKGNSAANSIATFIFNALAATTTTASTFTAQNIGAKNYKRARLAFGYICLISSAVSILMVAPALLFRNPLLALYGVRDECDLLSSLSYYSASTRMLWMLPLMFVYAIMNACAGTIRGFGKSSTSAIITFFGTCVFRVAWIYTVFKHFKNLESIYVSFPISWFITCVFFIAVVFRLFKGKLENKKD